MRVSGGDLCIREYAEAPTEPAGETLLGCFVNRPYKSVRCSARRRDSPCGCPRANTVRPYGLCVSVGFLQNFTLARVVEDADPYEDGAPSLGLCKIQLRSPAGAQCAPLRDILITFLYCAISIYHTKKRVQKLHTLFTILFSRFCFYYSFYFCNQSINLP